MAELSRLTDSLPLRGKQLSAAVVIVLTWAAVVTPSLVQSFTAPKSRNFTSDTETASAASSLVNLALTVGLTGVLVLLVIRYLNDLPVDRRGAWWCCCCPGSTRSPGTCSPEPRCASVA